MDFIKRNSFFLICVVLAIAGIVLGVTGLQAMPKVTAKMGEVQQLYQSLNSLQSKPANQRAIDAQEERIERIAQDLEAILERAKALYSWEPLVATTLPMGDAFSRLEFARAYPVRMAQLADQLRAGQLPTEREVFEQQDRVANEKVSLPASTGPARTPAGVLTIDGLKVDAQARASVAAAQVSEVYVKPFDPSEKITSTASFDYSAALMKPEARTTPPELYDIWWAQVKLWIQEDVVNAIAEVNKESLEEHPDTPPWVAIVPIKEIVSIRVGEKFVMSDSEGGPTSSVEGAAPAYPANAPYVSFTGRVSNNLYDVVQFSIKLVMDERDIPDLIDKLSENSFHTLLRVRYMAEPVNKSMSGKIYGAEPVVRVVLDWETMLMGSVFRPLMPNSILEEYLLPIPEDRLETVEQP